MSQDNFNVLQPEALSDECLIAKKIYGRCKQQDCLRPIDCSQPPVPPCPNGGLPPETSDFIKISSSLYGGTTSLANATGETGPLTTSPITPGTVIAFDNTITSIKISNFSTAISNISVASPGQFGLPGFYDVTVQYTFSYDLTFYNSSNTAFQFLVDGTTTSTVPAYTVYTKQISLEGGVVDPNTSIAIGDSALCPNCNIPQNTNNVPYAYVQAIASPLVPKIGQYPSTPSTPCATATSLVYHADVVIGLFTIIELYRITNMTVASSGPIEVPQCQPSVINDPCVGFNQLLFPYDDFDPPYRKC
ncbi:MULTISPECIES: hypothetical protein [unclassified Clostridium]|uniref:hypothetical protein n=1 Tax=unclassified Clostridium TaxID=2614128 RepID=UPI001898AEF8|nr:MULTISPECIES: hypothetical protein [unclassified Clostridium]MBP3917075.1 hypothetical protein [Clostridium sp.]MEE0933775.1 hypothetical protein [Clostridium sp.]